VQPETISQQLAELEQALEAPQLPAALRESKEATRSLLRRRLTALEQRYNSARTKVSHWGVQKWAINRGLVSAVFKTLGAFPFHS
jgi:hypothetical protein